MVEVSDPVAGQRVVDVGCGTGALAIALKAKVGHGEVYGIDASPEMIEVAKRKAAKVGSGVEFRVALIEALPFADDSFDLVTSSLMLHHLPEGLKPKALREVRRVLKPGGRFLALDLSTMSHSPLGHLLTLLGRSHGASMVEELMPLLRDAGFEDVVALPTRSRSFFLVRAR
ncbi:MAG: methyltransferase domain-containing protein [Deltaproteobacteria bacterium]|nr:methyltransferase domain-containing protein [Deltaproteobacteria bacterium]